MREWMKRLIPLALALLTALLCDGCGPSADPESAEAVNIAFVVGIADGESKLDQGIDELAALPALPGTDYAFISIEGTPACIGEPGTIADLSDRGYTDAMMERIQAGVEADLAAKLGSYSPSSAEIDMAGAIQLGVRQLNANAAEGRRNILVLHCSGRSTTGLISMTETPLYRIDIETSVSAIAQEMNLDMSNIDEVIWYCCGECGGNQPALSAFEKAKMEEFYTALFAALGMDETHITFKDDLPTAEYYRFANAPVSSMEIQRTVSALRELSDEAFAGETALDEPIVISESKVEYKPDSAEFLDDDAAREELQPLADFLLEHETVRIMIYSTCAGDTDCGWLSEARSESVKSVMVAAGVDESRITVANVSVAEDPYYQFGLGTGSAASVNRKTVIIDLSAALAQELLADTQA